MYKPRHFFASAAILLGCGFCVPNEAAAAAYGLLIGPGLLMLMLGINALKAAR